MGSRCRLCGKETKNEDITVNLFNDKTDLPLKIYHLCEIKIDVEDSLPTTACWKCIEFVRKAWEFRQKVQKVQEELWITLEVGTTGTNSLVESENNINCINDEKTFNSNGVLCKSGKSNGQVKCQMQKEKLIGKNEEIGANDSSAIDNNNDDDDDDEDDDHDLDGDFLLKIRGTAEWHDKNGHEDNVEGWERYPWNCSDCHKAFSNVNDLREHHGGVHAQIPKYVCVECCKLYTKYSTFINHVKSHRPHLRFCCDLCGKWFKTSADQDNHRIGHKDDKSHECTACGKRFRVQSLLLLHSRSHLPVEVKNKHQCDQCPKRFGTKPNLMAHKRIHSGIREFTCDQCGKSFVQKGNLDNHILTHTANRPFTCSLCGKSFKTAVRLRKHSSVHSGLKPHQCDVCGRQFRERSTLKEHHRIHTGAMPFSCEYCGKAFRFKGVLTTHRRQHTGERPYSCLECQHHFTNWPNYNKHMKRRHGINTSVTVRKPQTIPPTGMPQRNPPGTVLAPPQTVVFSNLSSIVAPTALIVNTTGDIFTETIPAAPTTITTTTPTTLTFFPANNLYNISEEILQQRIQ